MLWRDALALGRVSNLPTVWSNLIAGTVLASGAASSLLADLSIVLIVAAFSLLYIGGMYLNDAFDAEIDARERPERPIPAGRIGRGTVFALGFGMLGAGVLLLVWHGLGTPRGNGWWPALGGLALAAMIVLYDWWHKANPLSPLIMGLCRVLVYVTAGLSVTTQLPPPLIIGAGLLLSYLIGLTYVAKQENLGRVRNMWPLAFLAAPILYGAVQMTSTIDILPFWLALTAWTMVALYFIRRRGPGDIPRAVVSLIAGISLLDAMLIAGPGGMVLASLAVAAFILTLALQKLVSGT